MGLTITIVRFNTTSSSMEDVYDGGLIKSTLDDGSGDGGVVKPMEETTLLTRSSTLNWLIAYNIVMILCLGLLKKKKQQRRRHHGGDDRIEPIFSKL